MIAGAGCSEEAALTPSISFASVPAMPCFRREIRVFSWEIKRTLTGSVVSDLILAASCKSSSEGVACIEISKTTFTYVNSDHTCVANSWSSLLSGKGVVVGARMDSLMVFVSEAAMECEYSRCDSVYECEVGCTISDI